MAASSSQCEILSDESSSELHVTTESKTMEQKSQQAEILKEKANERFKSCRNFWTILLSHFLITVIFADLEFNEAVELYTQAIELNPKVEQSAFVMPEPAPEAAAEEKKPEDQ